MNSKVRPRASGTRESARGDEPENELTVTRVFQAPRSLVFRAWIDPQHLSQWFGPEGFAVVSLEMDVRPGGAWRKCMRSPEGKDYWRRGVYCEIVEPEKLVFTYVSDDPNSAPDHETLVTVTFEDLGERTLMTLTQSGFESMPARDAHVGGWESGMRRFEAYLSGVVTRKRDAASR